MDHLQHYLGARNAMAASEDQLKVLADQHDLTVIEFIIVVMVGRGVDRSSALTTETGYNQTTVSHNISDLEDRGLLERARVSGDARGYKLCLTDAGKAIAASVPESF